jgi:2-haloacid dehalogenase
VLIFDVNETLLDLDALAPHFERIFGRSSVLREWFAQLILYSAAITLTGDYVSSHGVKSVSEISRRA